MISDETFGKKEHILKPGEFRAVYKKGRSFRKDGFILSVMPNGLAHNRLGFSISSANVKRACVRNLIRRSFKEAYRRNKAIFKPAFDMVVIVRKSPEKKFLRKDIKPVFLDLAKKAGVLL